MDVQPTEGTWLISGTDGFIRLSGTLGGQAKKQKNRVPNQEVLAYFVDGNLALNWGLNNPQATARQYNALSNDNGVVSIPLLIGSKMGSGKLVIKAITMSKVSSDSGSSASFWSETTLQTDSTGTANFRWTGTTKAGTYLFKLAGINPSLSIPVAVTVLPGEPKSFNVISGGSQMAAPGATLGQAVVLQVSDTYGDAVASSEVEAKVTQGSIGLDAPGQLMTVKALTDANGRVNFYWQLGTTIGKQILTLKNAGGASLNVSAEAK